MQLPMASTWWRALQRALAWSSTMYALTALLLCLIFVGFCLAADRIHDDIGLRLGAKLALLELHPGLIFAGDSRTAQQVDPALAASVMGQRLGYAINIGVIGNDPLAVLAAVRERPGDFRHADLVLNLSPYHINDGSKKEFFFSTNAIARMDLMQKLQTFLLDRPQTLLWFIRASFEEFAWRRQHAAAPAPIPARLGLEDPSTAAHIVREPGNTGAPDLPFRYTDFLNTEIGVYEGYSYYRAWRPDGFKAGLVEAALCELRPLVRRLVIVAPPWAPILQFTKRPAWRALEGQFHDVISAMARQCGFEFLNISEVPGLGFEDFLDEAHISRSGMPAYTEYLMDRLGYRRSSPPS